LHNQKEFVRASGGGLTRDSLGNWVKGFSGSIGHATSMIA